MHCDVLQNAVEAIECIMTSITRSYECNWTALENEDDAFDVVMTSIGRSYEGCGCVMNAIGRSYEGVWTRVFSLVWRIRRSAEFWFILIILLSKVFF